MSIPSPSPPDSPTSSASVKYGALPRLSHPFPTTPFSSDSALPSFFSSVHPPETAPQTPVHFDEESSIEDAVVMTGGKSVWLSAETSSSMRSLPTTPKGHPLSSRPASRSRGGSDYAGLGLGRLGGSLAGLLKLESGKTEGRKPGRPSSPVSSAFLPPPSLQRFYSVSAKRKADDSFACFLARSATRNSHSSRSQSDHPFISLFSTRSSSSSRASRFRWRTVSSPSPSRQLFLD